MNLPDFLILDHFGYIHVVGHRIGLYHIIKYYLEGYSPQMLGEQFPTLTDQQLQQLLDFYRDNQAEVDAYMTRYRAEVERQAALPQRGPGADELKRRLAAQRSAESA
jgi:uncharacterized protein (DUF433 family)